MWGCTIRQSFRVSKKEQILFNVTRPYSITRDPQVENVRVTCGSAGFVTLNIHNFKNTSSEPLIIYLPSLLPGKPTNPSPPPSAFLSNTVVQINARWSQTFPFPAPIHDTLFAYDWILKNLLSSTRHGAHRPVAIYGTRLGGTLATSLALTESRPSQRPSISALAVRDAIFDWSKIATSIPPCESPPSHPGDMSSLYEMRSQLFTTPASAFDAFASPILFFRTSGLAIPPSFPQSPAPPSPSSSSSSPAEEQGPQKSAAAAAAATRKSHLTFPPRKSGLMIPMTRLGVSRRGEGGVLRTQAEELVKLMRRSIVLHEGKERRNEDFDGQVEAEKRVRLVDVNGGRERDEGEWAAEFFRDVLGEE